MSIWQNPCIICHKKLDDALDDPGMGGQPYAGTAFRTQGHYGSTVFDPMTGDQRSLRIVVCDECLVAAAKLGLVLDENEIPRSPVFEQRLWDGKA